MNNVWQLVFDVKILSINGMEVIGGGGGRPPSLFPALNMLLETDASTLNFNKGFEGISELRRSGDDRTGGSVDGDEVVGEFSGGAEEGEEVIRGDHGEGTRCDEGVGDETDHGERGGEFPGPRVEN